MDSPPPHVGSWDPSTKRTSRAAADAAAAEALQQQLLSGYGSGAQLLEGGAAAVQLPGAEYPARLAGMLLAAAKKLDVPLGSALEVGAGVGATSFQLAAGGFEAVLGVEHDARAVGAATAAQQTGSVAVGRKVRRGEGGACAGRCRRQAAQLGRLAAGLLRGRFPGSRLIVLELRAEVQERTVPGSMRLA